MSSFWLFFPELSRPLTISLSFFTKNLRSLKIQAFKLKSKFKNVIYVLTKQFEVISKIFVSWYFWLVLERLSLIFHYSLGFEGFGASQTIPKLRVAFGRILVSVQNPSFLGYHFNCDFKCLTLRLSYGLVLVVVGLLNGTLKILWIFHRLSPWAIQELLEV
jgi:hypothetical protein